MTAAVEATKTATPITTAINCQGKTYRPELHKLNMDYGQFSLQIKQ